MHGRAFTYIGSVSYMKLFGVFRETADIKFLDKFIEDVYNKMY